jgi:hypothetical protein
LLSQQPDISSRAVPRRRELWFHRADHFTGDDVVQLLRIASIAAVLALAGCSASSIDFKTMTAAELLAQPDFMTIVPFVPKGASVAGPVTAEICNKKRSDRAPTDADILRLLKQQAARIGATALAEVSYKVEPAGTDTCFTYASAKGTAFMRQG